MTRVAVSICLLLFLACGVGWDVCNAYRFAVQNGTTDSIIVVYRTSTIATDTMCTIAPGQWGSILSASNDDDYKHELSAGEFSEFLPFMSVFIGDSLIRQETPGCRDNWVMSYSYDMGVYSFTYDQKTQ